MTKTGSFEKRFICYNAWQLTTSEVKKQETCGNFYFPKK